MPRIVTNTTYESFFWVEWNQVSQDIPGNKTRINWACGVNCGHSFYSNAIRMSAFTINGVKVYGGGTYSNFSNGNHTIASGTLDIGHNTDGTKTFSISSFTGWLYSNHNYSSNGGSFSLPQIPRKATITASPESFTDQDNPSITISNPGGFRMDVWLEPNPNGDHLCIREGITLDANGKYTWELTPKDREDLRERCPGKDCTIRIGVYTHIGSGTDADFHDRKFIMEESDATRPVVSVRATVNNTGLDSNFTGLYVQGKSKVDIVVSGSGKYGAGTTSVYAVMEGKTYQSGAPTSDVIQGSGTVTITGYVKDGRGFTGSAATSISVIPYSKPMIVPVSGENAILCYRCDQYGNKTNKGNRLYLKAKMVSSGVESEGSPYNYCELRFRVKDAKQEWSNDQHQWVTIMLSDETETGEYIALLPNIQADLRTAYTVQLQAIDNFQENDIKTFDIPTEDVALHLGAGGKRVSVGSYCLDEEYTFHCEWKAIFDSDIIVQNMTLADYIKSVINEGG